MATPRAFHWMVALLTLLVAGALTATVAARRPQQPDRLDGRIAITNKSTGVLTVLNLRDRSTRVAKAGYLPHEAVAAQGLVFVSNYGSAYVRSSALTDVPGNTLSVIDLSRPEAPVETIDLGPGRCAPHGLAATGDERRVYVTCEVRQEILAIDVATRTVLHAIPTNQAGSHMLVVTADGARAYVANFWHGTVSVLDLRARSIIAQVATAAGTEGISLSPDERHLYTSSAYDNDISKIDTRTFQVVGRAVMSNCLGALRVVPVPPTGSSLVVHCADNDTVLVVDAETLKIRHRVPVGDLPIGIAVPGGRFAYSANMNDGTISAIDIEQGVVVQTMPAGDLPDGIVYLRP
jgi:YVTN family beta-propeller protein